MNFTFADINNAFQNLVQPDTQTSGSKSFESSDARPSSFADNLNQVIKDARAAYEAVTGKSNSGKKAAPMQENSGEMQGQDLDEMDQLQGLPFLSKLQNLFLSMSGGDLSKITLDAEGLDDLKKLLLKAGFDPGDVEELMSGLKEKAQTKDLGLDEVMKSLSKLSTDLEEEIEAETLLETSALPFITTILNSLGLPKETVDQIISQADRGQKGISLDVVIDQLNTIETQSFFTGQPFQSKEGETSFSMLFEQLGLVLPENGTSQLGLSDFLSSLKTLKEKMGAANKQADGLAGAPQADGVIKESSNSLIDSLFKHISIQSEQAGTTEFSEAQIKDQFKNELLIPDKNNLDKNGLFAQEQSVSNLKSDPLFQELESVLTGKPGSATDGDSKLKDVEEIIKFSKSDSTKTNDSLQASLSEAKTDSLGTALKAKATARSMPAYVMNQVEKSIVRAVNQGENTLKLQLKPAELGRLVMTIDNVGNSMKVSITTENPVAKDILASHVNELKTVLAAAGISLDKFDVDMSSNFRQSMADTKNQSGNSNGKNKNTNKNSFDSNNMEGLSAGSLAGTIQDGSYHFVA